MNFQRTSSLESNLFGNDAEDANAAEIAKIAEQLRNAKAPAMPTPNPNITFNPAIPNKGMIKLIRVKSKTNNFCILKNPYNIVTMPPGKVVHNPAGRSSFLKCLFSSKTSSTKCRDEQHW